MVKKIFSMVIISSICLLPLQETQAITYRTKTITGGVLTVLGSLGTLYCYKQKKTYDEKIKELQSYIKKHHNERSYDLLLSDKSPKDKNMQVLMAMQKMYDVGMVACGVLTLGACATTIWSGIRWAHGADNTEIGIDGEELPDLEIGQEIEVFPQTFVTAHEDGTFTVRYPTSNKIGEIPGGRAEALLRRFNKLNDNEHFEENIQIAKLCEATALIEERKEREALNVIRNDAPSYSQLLKETARAFTKFAKREQLSRRDKFVLSHYDVFRYNADFQTQPNDHFEVFYAPEIEEN